MTANAMHDFARASHSLSTALDLFGGEEDIAAYEREARDAFRRLIAEESNGAGSA
ncbi:hypothetical protein J2X03_003774 [Microbacterium trichothecenolyticum]|nr:hypothetical protein [Microbacterium trichothecenolyticum]